MSDLYAASDKPCTEHIKGRGVAKTRRLVQICIEAESKRVALSAKPNLFQAKVQKLGRGGN
jgi:hypothetical protein